MSTFSLSTAPTVVITGANGFIGTHVVEAFLKRRWIDVLQMPGRPKTASLRFSNFEATSQNPQIPAVSDEPIRVVGVDLPDTQSRSNARRFAGSACYQFYSTDQLLDLLDKGHLLPQLIVHNGACSSTVETDPLVFKKLNLEYSQKLFTHAARLGIPFIYASSASVYGDGTKGFSDSLEANQQFLPLNLYGKSKHDFDSWALSQELRPSSWFGLRYFNVYGPFEAHKHGQASMVYHAYQQITRTGKVKLFKSTSPQYGDGMQVRDFIYVEDIVRYTLQIAAMSLQKKFSNGEGFFVNLGTGYPRTWIDLVSAVFLALKIPVNIEFIPMPTSIANHYQNFTKAEHGGLRALHLPVEFTPLEKGVAQYVTRFLARGL